MIPAPTWTPKIGEYHQLDGRWSSSMLKVFRESRPLARDRYVTRVSAPPDPTPAMQIGSAVNALLVDDREAVVAADCATRRAKAFRQQVDRHPDAIVLPAPEYDRARAIAGAVLEPQTEAAVAARALLIDRPGVSEYAVRWTESVGGVEIPCKALIDRLTELEEPILRVELKTTRDPSPEGFSRQAWNFGYHAQAAFYGRGLEHVLEDPPALFVVAIRNDEPFEVAVYQFAREFLDAGHRQITEDLQALAGCLETDDWTNDWERLGEGIPELELPPWAAAREDAVYDVF